MKLVSLNDREICLLANIFDKLVANSEIVEVCDMSVRLSSVDKLSTDADDLSLYDLCRKFNSLL